jgi:hypothetical protein
VAHRRLAADAWIFRFIDLGRDYLSRVEAHVILLRLRISENGSGKREWLGFVQPVGLVVAPPVLVDRGVIIDRNIRPHQERLDALLNDDDTAVADIRSVFTELLGWEQEDLADPAPEHQVRLPELDVTLEPTWQVRDREGSRQLLIRCEPQGPRSTSPSRPRPMAGRPRPRCVSSAYCAKLAFPPGCSARRRASVWSYTPAGETSGHITFRIADMAQVMGRPILAAFSLLLGEYRMFRAEPRERLGSLVAASREAQNLVSTVLGKRQARCRCSRTERSGGCSNGCWYSTASGSPIARLTSKKSARSTAGRAGKRGLALEPNLGPKRPDTGSHIG